MLGVTLLLINIYLLNRILREQRLLRRPASGMDPAKSKFTALIRLDAGLQMIQEETLEMVMFFILSSQRARVKLNEKKR